MTFVNFAILSVKFLSILASALSELFGLLTRLPVSIVFFAVEKCFSKKRFSVFFGVCIKIASEYLERSVLFFGKIRKSSQKFVNTYQILSYITRIICCSFCFIREGNVNVIPIHAWICKKFNIKFQS